MIDDLPDLNTSNCQKYHAANPLVRRLLRRFLEEVSATVGGLEPSSIVDLGCGEGVVARLLHRRFPEIDYTGLDTSERSVKVARALNPELRFEVRSLLEPPPPADQADVAICLEVLEHLPDADLTAARILSWTRERAIISVPWEPFFRLGNLLRGRYVRSWGDHPEHLQHFNRRSLRALLSRHATVERIWTSFPWILALIRR